MARTYWTLEYNGSEQSFADWGFALPKRTLLSLSPDRLVLRQTVQSVASGPSIPFEGAVTVRNGRSKNSGGVFSGGVIIFVGSRDVCTAYGSAASQGFNYTFVNCLQQLADEMYRQAWFSGETTHVILNQDGLGQYIKTGAQIRACIDYAATRGIAIQPGDIEDGLYIPWDEKTDLPILDVIRQQARWSPNAVSWLDYNTTPATFHFRKRSDLQALNFKLPLHTVNDAPDRTNAFSVTPRPDLQRNFVQLLFERTNEVDGSQNLEIIQQIAPVGHPGTGRRGFVSTINLQGARISHTTAEIVTVDFAPALGVPNDFWKKLFPAFNDAQWAGTIESFDVVDAITGVAVDATPYSFMLHSGTLNDVMKLEGGDPVIWNKVKLRVKVRVANTANNTTFTENYWIEKTLTNATSGTYTTGGEADEGEPIAQFAGMAQYLYDATSELQHAGNYVLKERTIGDWINAHAAIANKSYMGHVLNLLGSDVSWETMNALVTQVEEDWQNGTVNFVFGPAPHLEKGDLLDLCRNNRARRRTVSKATRTEGTTSDGNVNLGKEMADTKHQGSQPSYEKIVVKDATDSKLTLAPAGISLVRPGTPGTTAVDIDAEDVPEGQIVQLTKLAETVKDTNPSSPTFGQCITKYRIYLCGPQTSA